jgi:NAD(P)H-dependent flavin oxidoreductase YrpB (nitropropane dioxygenase family)
MTTQPVLRTRLCDMLGIDYPILLAGMGSRGKATPAALVAAVSEAGGMGVIGGSGLPADELQSVIREVRKLTGKPIGVDLLLPASLAKGAGTTRSEVRRQLREKFPEHVAFVKSLMTQYGLPEVYVDNEAVVSENLIEQQVRVVMEEDVQVFAAGLGDPSWVVPRAHARGMTVMGLAGTPRNAVRQKTAGVDVVIAQGHEAGGHTGRIANFPLIPQVVDAVAPVPVVAAGGIADGRGVAAALALGAIGAWVGTAFLLAEESAIGEAKQKAILDGRSEDFEIRRVYTGKTMRGAKTSVIEAWDRSGLEPLPMPYQKIMMDDFNESAVRAGREDLISNPAGQIGGMLHERKPARQIMEELVLGAIETVRGFRDGTAVTI